VPSVDKPVPPLAMGSAPVNVLFAKAIVLFVSVDVLLAVSTFVGVMIPDSVAMFYSSDSVPNSFMYII
jgi:hypothetical protein